MITLGLVEGFKAAALTDLTLRASPPGHEGFVWALLSAASSAGWESQRLLEDAFDVSATGLSVVTGAASIAALLAFRVLPASLLSWRDGEAAPARAPSP